MPSFDQRNGFRKRESLRTNFDTVSCRMGYEAFLRGFPIQNDSP